MFGILKRNNPLVMVAREKGKPGHKLIWELLIFLLVYLVGRILRFIPPAVLDMQKVSELISTDITAVPGYMRGILGSTPWMSIIGLFSTALVIGVCLFYCGVIEKRPIKTVGFVKRGGRDYIVGLLIGLGLFAAVAGIGALFSLTGLGGFRVNAASDLSPMILLFLVGYAVQGMSEEVLCRGYLMISAARKNSLAAAVIVSSLVFTALHVFNSGFGVLPAVNVFLFGFFMAVYMLRTGSIWGVAAIHSAWNFAEGNVFGFSVSGTSTAPSLLRFGQTGADLLSGGEFGPEGSVITTAVLLAAIVIVLYKSRSKKDF